jgi:hypothetical protein
MLWMSILDCRFELEDLEPTALVGVLFAGEDFAAGEKLIFVWRLGALARLRAISGENPRGEGESSGFTSHAPVASRLGAELARGCSPTTLFSKYKIKSADMTGRKWVYAKAKRIECRCELEA